MLKGFQYLLNILMIQNRPVVQIPQLVIDIFQVILKHEE